MVACDFFLMYIYIFFQGSFLVKVKGPEGWSWDPEQVEYIIWNMDMMLFLPMLFSCY